MSKKLITPEAAKRLAEFVENNTEEPIMLPETPSIKSLVHYIILGAITQIKPQTHNNFAEAYQWNRSNPFHTHVEVLKHLFPAVHPDTCTWYIFRGSPLLGFMHQDDWADSYETLLPEQFTTVELPSYVTEDVLEETIWQMYQYSKTES